MIYPQCDMKKPRREIVATREEQSYLAEHFGVSLFTIKNARFFHGSSILLRRIRTFAVNMMDCALNDNLDLYLSPL